MRVVSRVDANGLFLEDVLLEDSAPLPQGCVPVRPPEGFHTPKWTGSLWVEGKPTEEIVEARKAAKIDEFAARAITDLEPYFTGSHGDRETMYALAKYVQALCQQTGVPLTDQRVLKVTEVGDRAMQKKQQIEAASSEAELEGISWES